MTNYELEQKVYSGVEELPDFFEEVIEKRAFNEEGGLQAALVILPNQVGAKICEENGLASHQHSQVNLVRSLEGKTDFISPRQMSHLNDYREEQIKLITTALEGRIISNPDEINLVLFANERLTDYQIEVLQKIIDIYQDIRDRQVYSSVNLGISTEELSVEYGELTDNMLESIKDTWNKNSSMKV